MNFISSNSQEPNNNQGTKNFIPHIIVANSSEKKINQNTTSETLPPKTSNHPTLKNIFKIILAQNQTMLIFAHGRRFKVYTQSCYLLKHPVN